MNHSDPVSIPGTSQEASIILGQVLASLISGVSTEVNQTNDVDGIAVSVIPISTGLKFIFTLPSATAVAGALQADIVMSDVSTNPVQNKVIKAYIDDKFWTGTAAQYALLEDDTDLLCFLSDTNVIMFNGESYSLSTHVHGNLTYAGAIGTLEGLVVMTGTNGVLETVTVEDLKELIGASSGMNLLHNGEFASPFNTAGLTIYSTPGQSLDRWNLLGGTFTINAGHATLSQAAINTAQLRQTLPAGSYQRLMGQTLTLSVLLDDNQTVFQGSGVIDGVASTIMTVVIANGYSIRLVVDNVTKAAYVEINGGASVAAIDLFRVKLEIGATASIEDGVMDAALDWARVKLYDLSGAVIEGAYVRYDAPMTLSVTEQERVRTSINAIALEDIPAIPNSPDDINAEPVRVPYNDIAVGTTGWATYTAAAGEETDIQNLLFVYKKTITVTGLQANSDVSLKLHSNYGLCGARLHHRIGVAANEVALYMDAIPTAAYTISIVERKAV